MFAQPSTVVCRIKEKRKRPERKRENCDQESMVEVEEDSAGGDKTPRWSSTDSHRMAGGASTQN